MCPRSYNLQVTESGFKLTLSLLIATNCGLRGKKKKKSFPFLKLEIKAIYEESFMEKILMAMSKEVRAKTAVSRPLDTFNVVCSSAGREK